jgi:hypothetical protein
MKTLKPMRTSLLFFFLLLTVSVLRAQSPDSSNWHAGGDLHEVEVHVWKKAPSENRLATSADFLLVTDSALSISESRKRAEELLYCIDQSIEGMPTMENDPITRIATDCLEAMGYFQADLSQWEPE